MTRQVRLSILMAFLACASTASAQTVRLGTRFILDSAAIEQSAPDRCAEVVTIVNAHLEYFVRGDDGRRELLAVLAGRFNVRDGGNWGLLLKPGGRIPADILVWRPTLEHFDFLTDSGPACIAHGVIQPDWSWIPAPTLTEIPGPIIPAPVPVPPVGPDPLADVLARIDETNRLIGEQTALLRQMDEHAAAHSAAQIDALNKLRQGVIDATRDLGKQLLAILPLILPHQNPKK